MKPHVEDTLAELGLLSCGEEVAAATKWKLFCSNKLCGNVVISDAFSTQSSAMTAKSPGDMKDQNAHHESLGCSDVAAVADTVSGTSCPRNSTNSRKFGALVGASPADVLAATKEHLQAGCKSMEVAEELAAMASKGHTLAICACKLQSVLQLPGRCHVGGR